MQQKNSLTEQASEYSANRVLQAWVLSLAAISCLLSMSIGVLITRKLLRQLGGEPGYAAEISSTHPLKSHSSTHCLSAPVPFVRKLAHLSWRPSMRKTCTGTPPGQLYRHP